MRPENISDLGIVYSCYHQSSRDGEHFVPDHVITFQISGDLQLNDGNKSLHIASGATLLYCRNQLLKFVKHPPVNGEFQSLSIFLPQQMLKSFSLEYGIEAAHRPHEHSLIKLETSSSLMVFFDSLLAYAKNDGLVNEQFITIKQKELLLLLLQINPALKDILFDFTEPHKIDLEAFMNTNYHFNVRAERFAYLTGRSLAAFKRDFQKIFGTSPRKWLQQKRLQEAHYLIKEKGKTASAVYLDLGFEDLSHFSFAFKKQFGVAPSKTATS